MKHSRNYSHFAAFCLAIALIFSAGAQAQKTTAKDSGKKTATTAPKADESASHKVSGKLDINTATKEELDALPGIGAAYSQKIIDHRPYKAKNELVTKKVIPQSTYDKIKDQIIAHQAK